MPSVPLSAACWLNLILHVQIEINVPDLHREDLVPGLTVKEGVPEIARLHSPVCRQIVFDYPVKSAAVIFGSKFLFQAIGFVRSLTPASTMSLYNPCFDEQPSVNDCPMCNSNVRRNHSIGISQLCSATPPVDEDPPVVVGVSGPPPAVVEHPADTESED